MLPSEANVQYDWLVKEEAETDWAYGQRPEQRSTEDILDNGIILLDKPNGPTSNQVSVWAKHVLERGKAGHSGTLDPHVTGVLPVGLNRGTKVLGPLSTADKEYVGVMKVGERFDIDMLRDTAEEFVGTNTQVPPEQSAVKRQARERNIYYLDIVEVEDVFIAFRVGCQKGFYVRTFCEQFGAALDTTGRMTDLRRTKVGVFNEEQLHTLQDVADQYAFWDKDEENTLRDMMLPVEAGVRHLKKVLVKDSAVAAVTHGANLGTGGIAKLQDGIEPGDLLALLTLKGELIATAEATMTSSDMVDTDGDAATLDRVYMQNDIYPKQW